ncbi:topoisomerase DNA-binding C4 zinc finger domain-containing protein [uncultured Ferrimonas sp.]|uniref:DNA topoisomerase family protein n=1 Tax=uncultured Ferrimonas sp. TaxID=432640 RepID=UPI00260FAEFF|nr:topoisomerase DNA-binding C4 zinc finger domain-containing protein [uncultured Ferrimonas sp.]
MAKIDQQLFSNHEHALESDHGNCPDCGQPLQLKHGKHGAFVGCSAYPNCEFHRPLVEKAQTDDEIMEGTQCPKCSLPLALKSGRYGFYIGCSGYPECDHIVRQDEPEQQESLPSCPQCQTEPLTARTNRFGKKFYACSDYPKCKYLLNDKPVAQSCPECGWGVLVAKKVRGKRMLCCPQRACKYQTESL